MGKRESDRRTGNGAGVAVAEDPVAAAEAAGLVYVRDDEPGWTRRRCGKGWSYKDEEGRTIRDPEARRRIEEEIVIPPAWTDVWICPHPEGHIQATGRDDAGRKQYRYHSRWREVRNATKFHRMLRFGRALPRIRERVREDLDRDGLPREKVLAALVRLLDLTHVRIGNDEYRRSNGTFGLTTLRDRHVEIRGRRIRFSFQGKGGLQREATLEDPTLAEIVRNCRDIPGQHLFQYEGPEGKRRQVASEDVNGYVREAAGEDFTAKDFRTWTGTLHALVRFCGCEAPGEEEDASARILEVVDEVADALGNTRQVCRDFYIHPGLVEGWEEGWLREHLDGALEVEPRDGLAAEEVALLDTLARIETRRKRQRRSA